MRVVELNEVQMEWMLAVSYVYMQNDKFEDSIALLELVLANYSTNLDAIKGLSFCYYQVQRFEESIKASKRYLALTTRLDSKLSKIYLLLAKAYKKLDKSEEAKKALTKYQKLSEVA